MASAALNPERLLIVRLGYIISAILDTFLFLTFFTLLFVCLILSSMVVQKFESLFWVYRQKFCLHTFYLCLSSFKIVSIRGWSPTNDKNISLIKNAQTKNPILSLLFFEHRRSQFFGLCQQKHKETNLTAENCLRITSFKLMYKLL